jgi:hypothetical protein
VSGYTILQDDYYSTWKNIHRGADNNRYSCGRKSLNSKDNNVTDIISVTIPSKAETISYFGLLCYENQQKPGQSLNTVGLYLPIPVFTNGQLYVAFLRVTRTAGLRVMVNDED